VPLSFSFSGTGWHLATWTWTGTTYKIYVDGVIENTAINSLATSGIVHIAEYPGGSNYFNCSIDDVHIYNRALSAADVSQLCSYTGKAGGFFALAR